MLDEDDPLKTQEKILILIEKDVTGGVFKYLV